MHKYSVELLVCPLAGEDLFLGVGLPELGLMAALPPRFFLRPIAGTADRPASPHSKYHWAQGRKGASAWMEQAGGSGDIGVRSSCGMGA